MNHHKITNAIVLTLIFSVPITQIVPAFGDARKVRAAFIGITFEDLPQDVQERLLERVSNTLREGTTLQALEPGEVQEIVGSEKVAATLAALDPSSLAALAQELQADYVYAGQIANNSRNTDRILLAGDLYRYDRATNLKHRFEVLKYYENIGVELLKFKQEFVETIAPQEETGKLLPYLIIAGVTAAGFALWTVVKSESGGEGTTNRPPDVP